MRVLGSLPRALLVVITAAAAATAAASGASGASGAGPAATGRLAYLTCDYPACETVVLSSLDLATNASAPLWSLPAGSLDDEYGGNALLADGGATLLLSLQYDVAPGQGALVAFDLAARRPRGPALNVSSCVVLLLDPSDATGARLLCLRIVQGGPDGEVTQLRHIDRRTGADALVAPLFPQHATFGEGVVSRGVLYVPMAPLSGSGAFFIAAIDPESGAVLSTNATFAYDFFMVGLVSDAPAPGDGTALSVVRTADANGQNTRGFLARVDLAAATATQIGPDLNLTKWTQLNALDALDAAGGVLYLTAFDGSEGNDLHLLGLSTGSGAIVYDLVVRNPFTDVVFLT